jgi:hypothetical protein
LENRILVQSSPTFLLLPLAVYFCFPCFYCSCAAAAIHRKLAGQCSPLPPLSPRRRPRHAPCPSPPPWPFLALLRVCRCRPSCYVAGLPTPPPSSAPPAYPCRGPLLPELFRHRGPPPLAIPHLLTPSISFPRSVCCRFPCARLPSPFSSLLCAAPLFQAAPTLASGSLRRPCPFPGQNCIAALPSPAGAVCSTELHLPTAEDSLLALLLTLRPPKWAPDMLLDPSRRPSGEAPPCALSPVRDSLFPHRIDPSASSVLFADKGPRAAIKANSGGFLRSVDP